MKFTYYLVVLLMIVASCGKNEENPEPTVHNVKFSVAAPVPSNGRVKGSEEPKSVVVTIKDHQGGMLIERREMPLQKFGDNYITGSLTLESTVGNSYLLSEYLVLNQEGTVIYVTPREGSEFAHLVQDPLDILFPIAEAEVTTITPEVVSVTPDDEPLKYGYAQFSFNVVKTLSVVFSPFARNGSSLQLTQATIYIEGIGGNGEVAWNYEVNLEAGANNLRLRHYPMYRLTARKIGYPNWTRTQTLADKEKIEIVLEQEGAWEYTELWSELYGGSKRDIAAKTLATTDGGVLIIGNTLSTDHDIVDALGFIDAWILKLDAMGNVQWSKNFGTHSYDDFGITATEFADGSGFLIAGFTRKGTSSQPVKDGWIVKLNGQGSVAWEVTTGPVVYNFSENAISGDNNFILIGRYESNDATSILQIDRNGNTVWEKSSGDYPLYGGFKDIKRIGDAYLLSYNRSLYKMSADGTIAWATAKIFDDEADQRLPVFPSANGYVVFGQQNNFNNKGLFGAMVFVSSSGVASTPVPVTNPMDDNNEVLYDVATTESGNFVLIGQSNKLNEIENFNFIKEITADGTTLREKLVRAPGNTCSSAYPVFFRLTRTGGDHIITGGASTVCGNLPDAMGDMDFWASRIRL